MTASPPPARGTDSPQGGRIALVPLDERPACAVLPRMIAAVAGIRVETPPAALLPRIRRPGDPEGIARWLTTETANADAAVVCLETLGYGGLIASRTVPATTGVVVRRWASMTTLAEAGVPVHAVTLITRTPDSADAMEEPGYWDPHGPALHRLSADLHRASEQGTAVPANPPLPPEVLADFLTRRLRNHTLNLAALDLVAGGVLRSLVIGADDTAPYGLATAELRWLDGWVEWLGLRGSVAVRPGADEAGSTLVARAAGRLLGPDSTPVRVAVEAVDPAGLEAVAPYENVPVGVTARRQVEACGALPVPAGEPADLRLLVHTPYGADDWAVAPPAAPAADAVARAQALAERAASLLDTATAVAVADCAQPNGADPVLVRALTERNLTHRLHGYAGWNTAGNTLGSVAAHAVTAVAARRAGRFDREAHQRLLLHRFLEDWGYMTRARGTARRLLGSDPTRHDTVPDGHPVLETIAAELDDCRAQLPGFDSLAIVRGSVRLPWNRTFEADFALTGDAGTQRLRSAGPGAWELS